MPRVRWPRVPQARRCLRLPQARLRFMWQAHLRFMWQARLRFMWQARLQFMWQARRPRASVQSSSRGSSSLVPARSAVLKSCCVLRNSFNLPCLVLSCPWRLVCCILVAEVEEVAEGPYRGPGLLVMPRNSLSFQACPVRAPCS